MNVFQYWHAYYDALFLKMPIILPQSLLNSIGIPTEIQVAVNVWTNLQPLPQLPACFAALEQFLRDTDSWISCDCDSSQLETIEQKINAVMLLLECEKIYATQYWKINIRRVQASIVHFSLILKSFFSALLSTSSQNILFAARRNLICISLNKLKTFTTKLLPLLKQIGLFLLREQFKEQKSLTMILLKDFNDILARLPQISKDNFNSIPKLMDYICIVNPIQVVLRNTTSAEVCERIKAATVSTSPKLTHHSQEKRRRVHTDYRFFDNSFIFVAPFRSCQKLQIKGTTKSKHKLPQLFRFNGQIRKHSFYINSKKPTITTQNTKNKSPSNEKSVALSRNQQFSPNKDIKAKSKTMLSPMPPNQTKESHIQTQSKRSQTILSSRSQSRRQMLIGCEESEYERPLKQQKYNTLDKPQQSNNKQQSFQQSLLLPKTHTINLQSGRPTGWRLIREYVNQRIQRRKIARLIDQ